MVLVERCLRGDSREQPGAMGVPVHGLVQAVRYSLESGGSPAVRLIVAKAPDLTTIRVAGRLADEEIGLLDDACARAQRPLVLDLSDLTRVSDAGLALLRRLAREGVHVLGVSPYMALLQGTLDESVEPTPPRVTGPRRSRQARESRRPRRRT
jgi:anti-anti-sigma regulatory factor